MYECECAIFGGCVEQLGDLVDRDPQPEDPLFSLVVFFFPFLSAVLEGSTIQARSGFLTNAPSKALEKPRHAHRLLGVLFPLLAVVLRGWLAYAKVQDGR